MIFDVGAVGVVAVGLQQPGIVVGEQRGQFAMAAGQPPVEDDVAVRGAHDPEVALDGATALLIGIEELHRGLVALEVVVGDEFPQHQFVDRLGPIGDQPDPVGHALATELRTPLGGHRLEPVQRQVMLVFGDGDEGQQAGRRVAAHRGPRQRRGDHRSLATVGLAPELRAHDHAFDQLGADEVDLEGSTQHLGRRTCGVSPWRICKSRSSVCLSGFDSVNWESLP